MKKITLFVSLVLFFTIVHLNAQPWMQAPYLTISNPSDSFKLTNFYEIQKAFRTYEAEKLAGDNAGRIEVDANEGGEENEGKFAGYCQYKRWEWYMEPRVYPSGDISLPSTNYSEYQKYCREENSSAPNRNQKSARRNEDKSLTGNWQPLGPTGTNWHDWFGGAGRVNFFRFDPTDSNIMWTGAPSGGLWKSVDGGLNWTSNTDFLPIIGCSDVAINPHNTQIMYLATGDGNGTNSQLWQTSIGILKSTDGGTTWGNNTMNWQSSWNRSIYKLLINPINPDTVFAATSNGIYRTINGGTSWLQMQAGQFTDLEFMPGNPDMVYATAGVSTGGTFYKSTDAGTTFAALASGLPASTSVARLEIGVTPADPNLVYILAVKTVSHDFYGFYASTDSGNTFSLRANTPNILVGVPASQANYNLSMAVSPFHKDTIITGGTDLWRSYDGGLTWTKISSGNLSGAPFVHPDHHWLDYLPGSDSIVFVGNDGGIWKTTNRGTNWNPMNEGLQIGQLYKLGTSHLHPYTILTGHQDMATHRLTTNVWDIVTPNTGDGMECIYEYDNDSVFYLESYNGRIIQAFNTFPLFNTICTNTGSGVNGAGSWLTPIVMHPQYDSVLLVGKMQVYRTTNSGVSFSQVGTISTGATPVIALAYAPSNTNFIYAAKLNHFYVCSDGNTFTERTIGLPTSLAYITGIAVSNTDPARAYVTFSGYSAANKVFYTTDTGHTWTNYSTGLPNIPVNCIVYQNGTANGLYVGTDIGVYFVSDTLTQWQSFFNGLPNVNVQELEIAYSAGKIRAATSGRGLWESDLASPASTVGVSQSAIGNDELIIYPNPANNEFQVSLNEFSGTSSKLKIETVKIINVLGECVFLSSPLRGGREGLIDISSLSKGIYFVQVKTENGIVNKKLVKE